MNYWHGHHAITIAVLAELQARSARASAARSVDECALHVACEFWAGVHNHTLREHLAKAAVARLLVAERAFVRVGAVRVGRTLRLVRVRLAEARPRLTLDETVPLLESKLILIDERVDSLIARFATAVCADESNRLVQLLKCG